MYKHFFKRLLDSFIAFVVLGILFIPLVIITVWLHFANKGAGAFFFQERPGKDGKTFKIVKFKTMTDECDVNGNLLPDEMRLTKVGKFVRSTSIDELPQFWNVLVGDMSLIGPRRCWCNIYLYIVRSRLVATKCVPESPVGRSVMAAIRCHGVKNLL